jgi:hypothetical protein
MLFKKRRVKEKMTDKYESIFCQLTEDEIRYYGMKMRGKVKLTLISFIGIYICLIIFFAIIASNLSDIMIVVIADMNFTVIYVPLLIIFIHFRLKKDDGTLTRKYIKKQEGFLIEKADTDEKLNHFKKGR